MILLLTVGTVGYSLAAGVWDAYTGITCANNPPISLVTSPPYAVGNQVQFHQFPVQDYDRRFTAPSTYYYNLDSFTRSDAYNWVVKDASGVEQGSFLNGKNTSNAAFPDVYWIPSVPGSNLTVYNTVKDDPKALGSGETGTRDDPDKVFSYGTFRVGGAYIFNLAGNVAGTYISGTGISVNMYVVNMYYTMDHTISVILGASDLAAGSSHVKVSPVSPAGQPMIRTDASGNWQSSGSPGWVYFDSTHMRADASSGDLKVRLVPSSGTTYFTNAISGITLYNKAYVLGAGTCTTYGDTTADAVSSQCASMNHSVYPASGANSSDHRDTILSNLPTYTVFYIYTHGAYDESPYSGMTSFRDCDSAIGDDPATECLSSGDIATAIAGKSGVPEYNIVHIDACDSAGDGTDSHNDMAIAFGILNADGSSKTDRAYIGFNGACSDNQAHANWSGAIWQRLQAGDRISAAVTYANNNYNPGGTAAIYGDANTTLHKVY